MYRRVSGPDRGVRRIAAPAPAIAPMRNTRTRPLQRSATMSASLRRRQTPDEDVDALADSRREADDLPHSGEPDETAHEPSHAFRDLSHAVDDERDSRD